MSLSVLRILAITGAAVLSAAVPSGAAAAETGKAITVASSEFGPILFDVNRQAIYVFEKDRKAKSSCYGDCAKLWPPVLTKGKPRARGAARATLLGTTKRKDGRRQVTYAGKPLYFYAHEDRGEVLCHNVFLNGGLWWVVGPNGKAKD